MMFQPMISKIIHSSDQSAMISKYLQLSLGACVIAAIAFWSLLHHQEMLLLAVLFIAIFYLSYTLRVSWGICLVLIYLILLGDIRRILSSAFGFPDNDPLILVGPVFICLAAVPIIARVRLSDLASKMVLCLILLAVLQVFNPGQGGLAVGLSGVLLYVPPLLWFWIGRQAGDPRLTRTVLFGVMVPLGTLAAILGIYQSFVGFLPWQKAWVEHVGKTYSALYLGGNTVRSFGFSVASSEYSNLLLLCCIAVVASIFAGYRKIALTLFLLLPALVLASSRGAILHLLLAGAIAWSLNSKGGGTRILRLVLALVIGFGGLILVLGRFGDYSAKSSGGSAAGYAIEHQAAGLSHPLDQRYSTAGIHSAEIVNTLILAFEHPIGYGVGATNGAAVKFGGVTGIGSEFDISDAFAGLGVPGGFIYLTLIGSLIYMAISLARNGPKDIVLPITAMMITMIGDWMFPGEYATGALFWFLVGSITRLYLSHHGSLNHRPAGAEMPLTLASFSN